MKNYILLFASVGLIGTFVPETANAASWHSSSVPSKLRGNWHATANHSQGVHIYKHSIHYKGEKAVKVKWRYLGHNKYSFKYSNPYGDRIHLHYFNHHKITMNSYWHNYFK